MVISKRFGVQDFLRFRVSVVDLLDDRAVYRSQSKGKAMSSVWDMSH